MTVICIDASNQFPDVGFAIVEGRPYPVLETIEMEEGTFYLLYRAGFFKYYFDARRFMPVAPTELMEYLGSEIYETFTLK